MRKQLLDDRTNHFHDELWKQLLDEHDWEVTIVKLTAYVYQLGSRYKRLREDGYPEGREPYDIAMEAISNTFNKQVNGEIENYRELDSFLQKECVRLLKNMVKRSPYKKVISGDGSRMIGNTSNEEETWGIFDVLPGDDSLFDELVAAELDSKICQKIGDDKELQVLYRYLKDGVRPIQIAMKIGVEIAYIQNLQKRLRRIINKVLNEMNEPSKYI